MEGLTSIATLILALIFSGLLMIATNGTSADKSFGSRITKQEYPIFIYIFIGIMLSAAFYLIFFIDI